MRFSVLLPSLMTAGGVGGGIAGAPPAAPSGIVTLAPEVVTASRAPQPPTHTASTVHTLAASDLQEVPSATLDGQLRSIPGFSLFRRSDSFTANPPSQGVSLRGLGPSGASRSLILLDGVPLNDPFGGWVAWTKVPRENLQRVELVPGGGATAWGNAALGGVVQMITAAPLAATTRATASAGAYGTRSFEFTHTQPAAAPPGSARERAAGAKLDLAARVFSTDGFPLIADGQRGPVDVDAWSRHRWIGARWRQAVGDGLELSAQFRGYEEKRGNGTPYQVNDSREKFGSVALAGQAGEALAWHAVAYAQNQTFASTFSGINAARTVETPASDQFAVPASVVGASWTGAWRHAATARSSAGFDTRFVRGETREHFMYAAGDFARLRVAGGRQLMGGIFGLHERPLFPGWRATLGARFDAWRDSDGHRRESDRATGAFLRNDRYAVRRGSAFSPSAGLVWQPADAWRVRGNLQRAFRSPSLNELYRPFRVGSNVTEANADLRTERVTSAELGAEWVWRHAAGGGRPGGAAGSPLTLGVTAFWNDLRDAVGNVTIARGPGTFPIVGFVAAGGVGRQRLNLERIRVQGVELAARWTPRPALTLSGLVLLNDATVREAGTGAASGSAGAVPLEGRRVAQVPRRSATANLIWRAPKRLTFAVRVRHLGDQFEDDENQLLLRAVAVVDAGVSRPLTPHLEGFLTAENLAGARIENGRSAAGLISTGLPRLVLAGLRGSW